MNAPNLNVTNVDSGSLHHSRHATEVSGIWRHKSNSDSVLWFCRFVHVQRIATFSIYRFFFHSYFHSYLILSVDSAHQSFCKLSRKVGKCKIFTFQHRWIKYYQKKKLWWVDSFRQPFPAHKSNIISMTPPAAGCTELASSIAMLPSASHTTNRQMP